MGNWLINFVHFMWDFLLCSIDIRDLFYYTVFYINKEFTSVDAACKTEQFLKSCWYGDHSIGSGNYFFDKNVVVGEMEFIHLKVRGILVNVTFKWGICTGAT